MSFDAHKEEAVYPRIPAPPCSTITVESVMQRGCCWDRVDVEEAIPSPLSVEEALDRSDVTIQDRIYVILNHVPVLLAQEWACRVAARSLGYDRYIDEDSAQAGRRIRTYRGWMLRLSRGVDVEKEGQGLCSGLRAYLQPAFHLCSSPWPFYQVGATTAAAAAVSAEGTYGGCFEETLLASWKESFNLLRDMVAFHKATRMVEVQLDLTKEFFGEQS